ncbi:MAG TPA: prephenate dehydrogenase/arogenate dehydrogenase family protein [bacterium]|nr:prephenate dehydrogenase/arogenate dehydrogenase family protein [bacterium]HOL94996.1 prephenate dehydrogenase/arogenate dehydrogenase family protein [bacterium]HPP02921.1 prephenate dehydrogenase/arogenate dehydrogenase family protein [bacterium]
MNAPLPFHRLGIAGVGLLGGSLGLALKSRAPRLHIVGIGRSEERLAEALHRGAIDQYTRDPAALDPPLDAVVLCTPVRLVPVSLRSVLPALAPHALVTDVGSTKAGIVRQCEAIAGNAVWFIGSHPIAGSHKTGVQAARANLFHNKICIVTPTPRSHPPALEAVTGLWRFLGMKVICMDPEAHDAFLAVSSHLPHIAAAALCHTAKAKGSRIETLLGTGFRDTTRVAEGDPTLWLDICLENREPLLEALRGYRQVLDNFLSQLERGDEEALLHFLTDAQEWKKRARPR